MWFVFIVFFDGDLERKAFYQLDSGKGSKTLEDCLFLKDKLLEPNVEWSLECLYRESVK